MQSENTGLNYEMLAWGLIMSNVPYKLCDFSYLKRLQEYVYCLPAEYANDTLN